MNNSTPAENAHMLIEKLRQGGTTCSFGPPVDGYSDLTMASDRIQCVEYDPPLKDGCRLSSGISFWIHTGSGLYFIGLWTGVAFLAPSMSTVLGFVSDAFSGLYLKSGSTPYSLPDSLRAKHHLRECELVYLLPENLPDQLDAARTAAIMLPSALDQRIQSLQSESINLCCHPNGTVLVTIDGTEVLTRLAVGSDQSCKPIPVLVLGGADRLRDNMLAVEKMCRVLTYAAYDPGWNNRIYFDDPYYSASGSLPRPEAPCNASFVP